MSRAALALVLLALPSVARAELHGFHFRVPPGWVDLSPGLPADKLAGIDQKWLDQARAGGNPVFAAGDVAHATDGFLEDVSADLDDGVLLVNEDSIPDLIAGMQSEIKKRSAEIKFDILEKGIVPIEQIGYLIPGRTRYATLIYSTTPERWAQNLPVFEAAARATVVDEKPIWTSGLGRSLAIGVLVLALAIAAVARLRKRPARG